MLIRKVLVLVLVPVSLAAAFIAGCSSNAPTTAKKPDATPTTTISAEAEIKAALDKLSVEDRKLALEQKTCPETDEPLGSMGVPVKITLKGQTVFLCCSNCQKPAEKDPDKTLKAVADAKAKK